MTQIWYLSCVCFFLSLCASEQPSTEKAVELQPVNEKVLMMAIKHKNKTNEKAGCLRDSNGSEKYEAIKRIDTPQHYWDDFP